MPEKQRTVLATTDDLRSMLALIHSTLVYGASAVALTLVSGWGFVGVKDGVDVPVILPILAIAAVLFTVVAWTTQEEVQKLGLPYRSKVVEPE